MPFVRLPDGFVAHVKMAKPHRRRCCGTEGGYPCPVAATIQCDYLVAKGKTCDAWVCAGHAKSVGADVDHCPAHARTQAGLFTSENSKKRNRYEP